MLSGREHSWMDVHITAKLSLNATADGGRTHGIKPGYRAACFVQKSGGGGWDAALDIGDTWMDLGETRLAQFFFPSWGRGAEELADSSVFYLREGHKVVGEARIVQTHDLTG